MPMRSGSASAPPASASASVAAPTAIWLTRSTPGSCSLVNQRASSNGATAAAAGLGNWGNTGCTAETPRITASNTAFASSPCGAIRPMPVTTAMCCLLDTTYPGTCASVPQAASGGLLGAQTVDQLGQAGEGLEILVLIGQLEAEAVFHFEQEFGHRERIEALLAHRLMRIER